MSKTIAESTLKADHAIDGTWLSLSAAVNVCSGAYWRRALAVLLPVVKLSHSHAVGHAPAPCQAARAGGWHPPRPALLAGAASLAADLLHQATAQAAYAAAAAERVSVRAQGPFPQVLQAHQPSLRCATETWLQTVSPGSVA